MQNYNLMLASLRDLVDNPTPRVPVALCLDVSGSMVGEPIAELNAGVQQYLAEMKSDDLTLYSSETAVVTFADQAVCAADFNTADHLQNMENIFTRLRISGNWLPDTDKRATQSCKSCFAT